MKKRINIIEEHVCGLKCKCGWNICIGGRDRRDLAKIKKYLRKLNKDKS